LKVLLSTPILSEAREQCTKKVSPVASPRRRLRWRLQPPRAVPCANKPWQGVFGRARLCRAVTRFPRTKSGFDGVSPYRKEGGRLPATGSTRGNAERFIGSVALPKFAKDWGISIHIELIFYWRRKYMFEAVAGTLTLCCKFVSRMVEPACQFVEARLLVKAI